MCSVCDATRALTTAGEVHFVWSDGHALRIEARGTHAEFSPAHWRFARIGGDWSPWLETADLAGALGRFGTDVKWRFVPAEIRAYLAEGGALEPVLARARAARPIELPHKETS
jgi:hypothetical protein